MKLVISSFDTMTGESDKFEARAKELNAETVRQAFEETEQDEAVDGGAVFEVKSWVPTPHDRTSASFVLRHIRFNYLIAGIVYALPDR